MRAPGTKAMGPSVDDHCRACQRRRELCRPDTLAVIRSRYAWMASRRWRMSAGGVEQPGNQRAFGQLVVDRHHLAGLGYMRRDATLFYRTTTVPSCTRPGSLPTRRAEPHAVRAAAPWRSVRAVESRGDAPVRLPDLLGQAGELLQVLLAVRDLLPPPRRVDRQDRLELLWRGGDAVEVELVLGRDDPDRRLPAADLTLLEPQQPQQRPQVVAVAGPQVVPIPGVAPEPVDMGEDRLARRRADDLQPVRGVRALGIGHERAHRHRVVPHQPFDTLGVEP